MKCSQITLYMVQDDHIPDNTVPHTFAECDFCRDLHIVYRDNMACVNFVSESGKRVNHDYPLVNLLKVEHVKS